MTASLQALQDAHGAWSDDVIGVEKNQASTRRKLLLEVEELFEAPDDISEGADCLLLLLEVMREAGHSADDLVTAAWEKIEINRKRKWGKPDAHGVVQHVED